jgi:SAM-dependent methyltransferase
VCGFSPPRREGYVELAPELDDEDGGFGAEGFAQLFDLESHHFWFQSRNRLVEWALRKYFGAPRHVLEVGCGTGFVLSHLERAFPSTRFSGGEAYPQALAFAASRLRRTQLYQLDVRALPFQEEFDVIGAFDVLEHVPEDEAALAELHDACVPGGGLVVTVPQHPWLWSGADETARHVRRYTLASLRQKVERAGFLVTRTTSFVTALLPPMIVSRLVGDRRGTEHRVKREFSISRPLSFAFGNVLAAERGIIRAGVSLPFGGSLLLVARRPR